MELHRRHMLKALAASLPAMLAKAAWADGTSSSSDDGGIVGADASSQPEVAGTEPATLTGQVLTYGGKPISGATVTFESLDTPPRPLPELAPVTDEDGRFSANLPPGRYRVTVVSPAGSKKSRNTSVVAGRVRHIRIWLPK